MSQNEAIKLTQYAKATGCSCKIAPAQLEEILAQNSPGAAFPQLLVGNGSNDDAAVYALDEQTALIATTDFFTPVVDEAFEFGRIAAANALSDVYAMGGKSIMAIAILGWPVDTLPSSLAQQVIEGGRAACADAGIPLAGGHSIIAAEPFFGLCVNGLVLRTQLKKNNTAEEGDLLFLTKPIGSGILTTARKRGVLEDPAYKVLVEQLTKLNRIGAQLGELTSVTAMTDVTGFGLLGHLIEMAKGSGLSAEVYYGMIPIMEGVKELAAQRVVPDATYRNWNGYSAQTAFGSGVDVMEAFNLLPDPQTNGGLLFSVNESGVKEVQTMLRAEGFEAHTEPIGRLVAKGDKLVQVLP
jgi:selenide, water dikinase